ncbi:hypothetical protein WJU23_15090 [Prosthecobacter sp. SYSU 5D2]|uniref:hypothetical protein n=1 Tax=Prosthecobacter sp. SYSU 5D2 TaxID=3134134 RepID=UPI0031FEAFB3
MTSDKILDGLKQIAAQTDANVRSLLLAGLVSELFRERGFEPVVVGGSAIEFYTDGAYTSGDTDICWAGISVPTPFERAEVMSQIPGVRANGTRSWIIENAWVDLLGELRSYGSRPFTSTLTPFGEVVFISVEEVLAERVFAARRWVGFNAEDDACAKKLMASILRGEISCDWETARQIAALPAYRCEKELEDVKAEVTSELETPKKRV